MMHTVYDWLSAKGDRAARDGRRNRRLRTCLQNIAYNTLQYNFARMLLIPQQEHGTMGQTATVLVAVCPIGGLLARSSMSHSDS
jgi:hypothetical protein